MNSKFILNVTPDLSSSGDYIFSVFFNPIQNSTLTVNEIENSLPVLCPMISNADPLCFCQGEICTESAVGGQLEAQSFKNSNLTEYTNVQNNCKCLSNVCQFAAHNNTNNAYAASIKTSCLSPVTACNNTFTYNPSLGVTSPTNQQNLNNACGIASIPIPTKQSLPNSNNGNNTPPSAPTSSTPSSTKFMISMGIAIIILSIIAIFMMN
jgi:hypothetical protein